MGEWLVEQFPVWGIPFQNWMVLVAAIILVSVLFVWLTQR
jgi:hypothetical protein